MTAADTTTLPGTTVPIPDVYATECPHCHAGPGARCKGPYGRLQAGRAHLARARHAERASA